MHRLDEEKVDHAVGRSRPLAEQASSGELEQRLREDEKSHAELHRMSSEKDLSLEAVHGARVLELEMAHAANIERIEEEKASSQALMARLQESKEAQQADVKHAEAKKAEADHLASRLEALEAEHAEELKRVELEKAAGLETLHASRIREMEASFEVKIERAKADVKLELELAHAAAVRELEATHSAKLASLESQKASGSSFDASRLQEVEEAHAAALERVALHKRESYSSMMQQLHDEHAEALERAEKEKDHGVHAVHSARLRELKESFNLGMERAKAESAAREQALADKLRESEVAHQAELARFEAEKATAERLERRLQEMQHAHASEMRRLQAETAAGLEAAHAAQLASVQAARLAIVTQMQDERDAERALHEAELKRVEAANTEGLEELHEAHLREVEHAYSAKIQRLEEEKAARVHELNRLQAETTRLERVEASAREAELRASEQLTARLRDVEVAHAAELKRLKAEKDVSQAAWRAESEELERALESARMESERVNALQREHAATLQNMEQEHAAQLQRLASEKASHGADIERLRMETSAALATRLRDLEATHQAELDRARVESEFSQVEVSQRLREITEAHAEELQRFEMEKAAELARVTVAKAAEMQRIQEDRIEKLHASHQERMQLATMMHEAELERIKSERQAEKERRSRESLLHGFPDLEAANELAEAKLAIDQSSSNHVQSLLSHPPADEAGTTSPLPRGPLRLNETQAEPGAPTLAMLGASSPPPPLLPHTDENVANALLASSSPDSRTASHTVQSPSTLPVDRLWSSEVLSAPPLAGSQNLLNEQAEQVELVEYSEPYRRRTRRALSWLRASVLAVVVAYALAYFFSQDNAGMLWKTLEHSRPQSKDNLSGGFGIRSYGRSDSNTQTEEVRPEATSSSSLGSLWSTIDSQDKADSVHGISPIALGGSKSIIKPARESLLEKSARKWARKASRPHVKGEKAKDAGGLHRIFYFLRSILQAWGNGAVIFGQQVSTVVSHASNLIKSLPAPFRAHEIARDAAAAPLAVRLYMLLQLQQHWQEQQNSDDFSSYVVSRYASS